MTPRIRLNRARKGRATAFDRAAGAVIKKHRNEEGLSQDGLAQLCGVEYQQVQKYENGTDRISLSRFVRIAKGLGIAPGVLIEQVVNEAAGTS